MKIALIHHTTRFEKQLGDFQKADHDDEQGTQQARSPTGSRRRLVLPKGGGPLLAIAKIPLPPLSLSSPDLEIFSSSTERRRRERSAYSRSAANHAAQEKIFVARVPVARVLPHRFTAGENLWDYLKGRASAPRPESPSSREFPPVLGRDIRDCLCLPVF